MLKCFQRFVNEVSLSLVIDDIPLHLQKTIVFQYSFGFSFSIKRSSVFTRRFLKKNVRQFWRSIQTNFLVLNVITTP